MKHLTVRNLPSSLASALEKARRRSGLSLNQTVIQLLSRSLGLNSEKPSNGLSRFAGTWTAEEADQFDQSIQTMRQIDEEDWR